MAESETKELAKVLQKQLESSRTETRKGLNDLYDTAQKQLRKAKSDSEADKKIRKEATATAAKALKARQSLDKQELTWRTDLNKNFKDIGSTITGGLEGMMSEAFGPLGGIAATLTTGFFKRSQENKKNIEMNQAQVDSGEMIVQDAKDKENEEKKKKKIETNKGEVQEDTAESAEETAGGISDTVAELDYTNQWLDLIEGHLDFISANTLTLEDQREMARGRGGVPAKKKVKGKKDDEFSWLELGGTILGAITGALMGAVAGLTVGFLNMWKNIFKFIGGKLAKMFPNVTKMLGDIFGKGGKLSNFFTSIKTFFTQNKAFKVVSDLIDTVKGAIAKALKPIKAAFTSIKTGFTSFFKSIKGAFKMITGPIDSIKKILGVGTKTGGGGMGFLKSFKTFFKIFKTFFAKLFLPLQVIISLVEGFFEAKDAVDKSEGFLASFFNSIVGFFGGILDGLIFGMLDLVKDGISWIAGFLGFEEVEKFLDSFSFSDMFNEFLDDIYAWFNLLFSDPVAALTNLVSSIFGGYLDLNSFVVDMLKKPLVWIMSLFGWDEAAEATEKFSLSGWVMGKWEDVKAWFTGIFSWAKKAGADGEGGWSITTFIDTVWTKVKTWFTDLFAWGKKAGATEDGGWSLTNFIYGKDGVVNKVKEWFKNLFSFGAEGEKTSIVGVIIDSLKTLPEKLLTLFTDLVDKIVGIIPGFGPDTAEEKSEDKLKELKLFTENVMSKDTVDIEGMQKGLAEGTISKEDIANMLAKQGMDQFSKVQANQMIALAGEDVVKQSFARIKGSARGAIVTKPAYLPASGTVVGEHASWSGKGAAGGGVPDGGSEAIIPLDGERGGRVLAEALAPAIAGAILNELMMARVGGGAEGGSAPTVIQDNSTNQNVTNNTIVRTPSPSGPGLHFEGRDFVHKIA